MIDTPEYKLAKFLDSIIKPFIPDSYIIQSSEEFLNKINTFNFNSPNQFLVSFDEKLLFTNVPLSQTIDIIANYIFSSDRNDHPPITKEVFVKLMHLATECMFLFKDELYKQVDGIALGSPLDCTMANFILGHLETLIFKDLMSYNPKLYVRYIANVFAVFDNVNTCLSFLNILNSQYDNIKFTIKKCTNTLQFLDVGIKISENTVDTWVWRKPTNTDLFLNFAAICPIKWKSGLVFCMLHRAKLICLSDSLFFREVEILKSLFLANNYPTQFFDKILRIFLALSSHHIQENENSDKCKTCFFKVPYIGSASGQFKKSLSELVYREFGLKLRLVYDTFKINRYFQLKIKIPHALCSNVMYQFQYSCDTNLAYVGMTTRHLTARACKHLVLAGLQKSAIKKHIRACAICREEKYTVNSFRI